MLPPQDPRVIVDLERGYFHGIRSAAQNAELALHRGDTPLASSFAYVVAMHARNLLEVLDSFKDNVPYRAQAQVEEAILSLRKTWERRSCGYDSVAAAFDESAIAYLGLSSMLKSEMPE
jgi:hypothetical protein